MRKTSVFIVILFHALSGILIAQEKYGFEAGGFVGPAYWKERTFQVGAPQASPPIPLVLGYDDKIVYGGRLNLLSRGYWGGEFSYGVQANRATLNRETFNPVELDGSVHHFFYNTALYPMQYRSSSVMPFLTAGIGLAGYHLSDETRERARNPLDYGLGDLENWDRRFAFNYGGGVKANFASGFGLRADFRHIFSDVPSYGLPKESSNPSQTVLPIQGKLQTFEGSIGIYFHFLK